MEAATTPNEEDEVLLHAELAAVDTLVAAISGKKLRKRYSFRMKRDVLQATDDMSEREAARPQGIPRWTICDWRKKKEEIFAFEGSEKTLSRAPGRPESVLFGMELITYVEDTRCDCLPLMARYCARLLLRVAATVRQRRERCEHCIRVSVSAASAVRLPPRDCAANSGYKDVIQLSQLLYNCILRH
ncbi:hypothetical protein L914_03843 [Phytophthora nicotianae]|uniref:HTH psq-type domain-containing protein n=1 Tax=Phytophthora nicotianae TaxID=4792 RepID=W2NVE6_PHYNI|nr:hypothetical protein L914_03843 [Phytophthora nicotianae]